MNHAAACARLMDAKTILSRCALTLEEGEPKARVVMAGACVRDALQALHEDEEAARTLKHLEVIADALTAPGTREWEDR